MARLGMDVVVVESMGRQLKSQGQAIRGIVRTVDGQVNSAGSHWWGQRGQRFVHEWRNTHRSALLRLAEAVDGLGQTALDNVREQDDVSGNHKSSLGGPPSTDRSMPDLGLGSFLRNLDDFNKEWDVLAGPLTAFLGVVGSLTTTARSTPYPKSYKKIFGGSSFMRYNRSLQHSYSPIMKELMESPAMKKLDVFGKGLTITTATADAYRTFFGSEASSMSHADKVEHGGADLGSALKLSKNPVTYLAGANVTAWSMVAAEAEKADLFNKDSNDLTWNYIKQNPGVILEEWNKAVQDMATNRIWKIFG